MLKENDFEIIYNADGTCTNWYCGKLGVILVYDDFSPEVAHWFCARCWEEWEEEDMHLLIVVRDTRHQPLAWVRGEHINGSLSQRNHSGS